MNHLTNVLLTKSLKFNNNIHKDLEVHASKSFSLSMQI